MEKRLIVEKQEIKGRTKPGRFISRVKNYVMRETYGFIYENRFVDVEPELLVELDFSEHLSGCSGKEPYGVYPLFGIYGSFSFTDMGLDRIGRTGESLLKCVESAAGKW